MYEVYYERVETFEWLFMEFIRMMGRAAPNTTLIGTNCSVSGHQKNTSHIEFLEDNPNWYQFMRSG